MPYFKNIIAGINIVPPLIMLVISYFDNISLLAYLAVYHFVSLVVFVI